MPNEYLYYYYYYYYFNCDAVRAILAVDQSRGEFLGSQQPAFYTRTLQEPTTALTLWHSVRQGREATFMKEARPEEHSRPDLAGGGYERVCSGPDDGHRPEPPGDDDPQCPNGSTVQGMPEDSVVEVPCVIDAEGVHPLSVSAPTGDQLGLMQQMKTAERLTIEAAMDQRPNFALKALALHPLADSVTVARELSAPTAGNPRAVRHPTAGAAHGSPHRLTPGSG